MFLNNGIASLALGVLFDDSNIPDAVCKLVSVKLAACTSVSGLPHVGVTQLMATAGWVQMLEAPHQQAQRLCDQVHRASSLPYRQHGHRVRDCHHHNLVLVGLHDDGDPAVPLGGAHHHFRAVPHSPSSVLSPPQTPEAEEGCQSCNPCSHWVQHGGTTRQELQQPGISSEPIAAVTAAAAAGAVADYQCTTWLGQLFRCADSSSGRSACAAAAACTPTTTPVCLLALRVV